MENKYVEAIKNLKQQVDKYSIKDSIGHPIEKNIAYIALIKLIEGDK